MQAQARQDRTGLGLSRDAQATLTVGPFSGQGQSRLIRRAADHAFKPDQPRTPFGLFWPDDDAGYLDFAPSGLTADCRVDCLGDFWTMAHASFPVIAPVRINLDNRPANHARRPQFMQPLTDFADEFRLTVRLAYCPPITAIQPDCARLGRP